MRILPSLTFYEATEFWSKIIRQGPDDCWPHVSACEATDGYGVFEFKGETYIAHRLAYFLHTGEQPGDLYVLHGCDNHACCNPTHLRLGTAADNARDAADRGRSRSSQFDVVLARSYYEEGLTHQQIADTFGCSRAHVGRLLHGRIRSYAVPDRTRKGRPLPVPTPEDVSRLWSNVIRYEDETACWPCILGTGTGSNKYPRIHLQGRMCLVHRVAYFIHYKQDPGDLFVLHECDNHVCCNPRHLKLGTAADNAKDMHLRGRGQAPKVDRDLVRAYRDQGLSQARIAEVMGCHQVTVSKILRDA